MISEQEVQALADLARLSLAPSEKEKLQKDLGSILDYISELAAAPLGVPQKQDLGLVKNVMRDDNNPHERAVYAADILAIAPRVKDGYIEVKKILDQNNG
jgi:aspartyl/glutamyl-tRNA(Asn/Gln) amidotransferase C subunit